MERPMGLPMGPATQSTGRMVADNGLPRDPRSTVRRVPPNNYHRNELSNSSISASNASATISSAQVIALAREEMQKALEDNENKATETNGIRTGVTLDLSHKMIQRLPDEVVDIMKPELERLALSHNSIATFAPKFAECTSLRYLNVRSNSIREFPLVICQLATLEILDLARNKLKILPPELVKLTSLKVLSLQKNRIEELPLCIGDMTTLQVLKLEGNPIKFPPKEVLELQATSPPNGGYGENDEIDELTVITSQIKKFLRQRAMTDRSETESGEEQEESSEGTETPRPVKRIVSGRFPIKVNGTDISTDLRSPAMPRAPPIPSRSHYRGLSQQNATARRPGVMPLTIGSTNERLRSNSENVLQASRISAERAAERSRRMGIMSKRSELDTVDEMKSNRHSHYRGLSHGSAMTSSNGPNQNTRSPASPADSTVRATYVRRLSSLPERKRESNSPDPVIEGAKGILFALFQIHPLIQNLLGLARDGTNKRTSLERVFYNANTHVEELDRDLQSYDTYSEEDEDAAPHSNENVHRACLTAVSAYIHVCSLLSRNVDTLLRNGDPRYIRTLLLLLYGSLAEVRNAGADLFPEGASRFSKISESSESTLLGSESTLRSQPRDKSMTPTRERPGTAPRLRSATIAQYSTNLRVATDPGPGPRPLLSARMLTSATPRSGDFFTSSNGGRLAGGEFTAEDSIFENIYLNLQQTSDMSLRSLPIVINHFVTAMRKCSQQATPEMPKEFWQTLIGKAHVALQTTEALKTRLSTIKLKEPGIRTQGAFWELCNAFLETYTQLVVKVKDAKAQTTFLPIEIITLLRPLQKAIKECGKYIQSSPWAYLATSQTNGSGSGSGAYSVKSPASQVPLPMTPQSAALGPAVQATVPSTPQNASYNSAFNGNSFERAETFLSNSSASNSRAGTMTSNDERAIPISVLSPMGSMNSRYNANGNGKMAY